MYACDYRLSFKIKIISFGHVKITLLLLKSEKIMVCGFLEQIFFSYLSAVSFSKLYTYFLDSSF